MFCVSPLVTRHGNGLSFFAFVARSLNSCLAHTKPPFIVLASVMDDGSNGKRFYLGELPCQSVVAIRREIRGVASGLGVATVSPL